MFPPFILNNFTWGRDCAARPGPAREGVGKSRTRLCICLYFFLCFFLFFSFSAFWIKSCFTNVVGWMDIVYITRRARFFFLAQSMAKVLCFVFFLGKVPGRVRLCVCVCVWEIGAVLYIHTIHIYTFFRYCYESRFCTQPRSLVVERRGGKEGRKDGSWIGMVSFWIASALECSLLGSKAVFFLSSRGFFFFDYCFYCKQLAIVSFVAWNQCVCFYWGRNTFLAKYKKITAFFFFFFFLHRSNGFEMVCICRVGYG